MSDEALIPDSDGDPGDGTPDGTRQDESGDGVAAGDGKERSGAADGKRDSVFEKRIADTEAALKERQAEFTRTSQDLAAVKEALAEAKGQLSVLTAKPAEQDEKDWLDGDEFKDSVVDEMPAKALKGAIGKTREEVVRLLQARDAFFTKKLEALEARLAEASPERQSVADVIDEFKDKPWFKAMPDAAKIAFAKETKAARAKAAGGGDEDRRGGSDSPTGSGRRVVKSKPSDGMSDEARAYLKSVVEPLDKRDDTSLM